MPCAPPKRLIFQSTLPRGERRSLTANKEMYLEFQSTLPRGERPLKHKKSSLFYYFNPRSHEGSDSNNTLTSFCVKPISIHAPTRGATSWGLMYGFSIKHFNPRSHEGSDNSVYEISPSHTISIHAPTRGATSDQNNKTYLVYHFNPRSHEGSDSFAVIKMTFLARFQSTLPRGERLNEARSILENLVISIHAPTRGATSTLNNVTDVQQISIHAPTRGATPIYLPVNDFLKVFQSTLPRGERQLGHSRFCGKGISIHAPTRGATLTLTG